MSFTDGLQHRATAVIVDGVRRTPADLRNAVVTSPLRGLIVGQIFSGMTREFDVERAGTIDAVSRWEVGSGDQEPEVHYVIMREGRCWHTRECDEDPKVTFVLDQRTLLDLAIGLTNGPAARVSGRIKIRGDINLAQRMTGLFKVPG